MASPKAEEPTPTPEPASPKEQVAEDAALAADISAAHAEKAADQAEDDAATAHKAALKAMPDCPHCGHVLKAHDDAEGNMHCYSVACGGHYSACCFAPGADGPVLRSGAAHRP